jgi:DNA modification methylase
MILLQGDCRKILPTLPDQSVHCCVTSPPYFGLRDYGVDGQIGLESTPDAFVAELVAIFREVRRVLRDDGTLWLNLGDSYNASPGQRKMTNKIGVKQASNTGSNTIGSHSVAGIKPKDLIGIPWRVAFALQADGWYLRQDIIWSKPNPMPESVIDRCTKAHEYIFLLSKNAQYYFDQDAIAESAAFPEGPRNKRPYVVAGERTGLNANLGGNVHKIGPREKRNKRSVWEVATQPFSESHFATFPLALIEPCILAGCPKNSTVLDPFAGAGTTGMVADRLGRDAILIELNPKYAEMIERRIRNDAGMFANIQTEETL